MPFPDYHWDLQHLLADGDWMSVHRLDTATFRGVVATGRVTSAQELAIYRVYNSKIVDRWGDLDSMARDDLTRSVGPGGSVSVTTGRCDPSLIGPGCAPGGSVLDGSSLVTTMPRQE